MNSGFREINGRGAPLRGAWLKRVPAVALLAICFVVPGLAQTDRGTITGTVTDPGGAVL